jgi:tetratricopeptide (TPR) repeat protein
MRTTVVILAVLLAGPALAAGDRKAQADRVLARLAGDGAGAVALSPPDARALARQAIDHLQRRELDAARAAYGKLIAARPFDANALYNLACADSLAGAKGPALDHLERAVRAGFRDADHIRTDPDLAAIRAEPRFAALLASLSGSPEPAAIEWQPDYSIALARGREERELVLVLFTAGGGGERQLLEARATADPALAAELGQTTAVEIDVTHHADELAGAGIMVPALWIVDPTAGWLADFDPAQPAPALVAALRAAAAERPPADLGRPGLTAPIRSWLAAKYFGGCDPASPEIDQAVEILVLPDPILEEIGRRSWVRRQLETFTPGRVFALVTPPGSPARAIHFRDGKVRQDHALDPARVRVLRRLYSGVGFAAPPAPELRSWRQKKDLVPAEVLSAAISHVSGGRAWPLSAETIRRAAKNLGSARDNGRAIATALGALGETEYGPECQWAAIWLLSRMDGMDFRRESRRGSESDLLAATDRDFFENVYYAVKARNVFPWGREVSDSDFLEQVLSPRGTNEPLQRWRRYFFDALAPEVRDLGAGEMEKAVRFARTCAYDFFQYEGATTWEDFGMLTALAVHEGRCEDCSNVENTMIRTLGLPAAQAFTPWWAHQDGNHAWTVVPSLDEGRSGNGKAAAKVYLKTWDGLTDITAANTTVTKLARSTKAADGTPATLLVFNSGDWRVVARTAVADGSATFEDVGCARPFVFAVHVEGEPDALFRIGEGGKPQPLAVPADAAAAAAGTRVELEKSGPLGEFAPDAGYQVFVMTEKGFAKLGSERIPTGALAFVAAPDRLYRITGHGIRDRPFTVDPGTGKISVH